MVLGLDAEVNFKISSIFQFHAGRSTVPVAVSLFNDSDQCLVIAVSHKDLIRHFEALRRSFSTSREVWGES